MSPRARMEYLESIVIRYRKSSKKKKSVIPDEFCITTGYILTKGINYDFIISSFGHI